MMSLARVDKTQHFMIQIRSIKDRTLKENKQMGHNADAADWHQATQ
jgi:hypothetical protein